MTSVQERIKQYLSAEGFCTFCKQTNKGITCQTCTKTIIKKYSKDGMEKIKHKQ